MNRSGLITSAVSLAGALCLWMGFTVLRIADPKLVASPIAVANEFSAMLKNGYVGVPLLNHILASALRTTIGFSCGLVVALPVGIAIGYSSVANAILSPFLAILRPIPVLACIPLAILWFGIGEFSKVALIALSSFLYMVVNISAGVKSVPAELLLAAESLGTSKLQLFIHVVLPYSMPFVLAAVRIGAGISWAVVVSAELIAAQQRLGYIIMDAATFFRIPSVYVGIALIGLIGFTIDRSIVLVERYWIHWSGK